MRIYAISDLHIDFDANAEWLFSACEADYSEDVLIVAGDISDELARLERCFRYLASRFQQVLFVPGNHELWVLRDDIRHSLDKFERVCELATRCGISMEVCDLGAVSIVPLYGWYDFSFAPLTDQLRANWMDFHACKWPDGWDMQRVTDFFLAKNHARLNITNDVVISFSHFLPSSRLLPSFVPDKFKYIFPVLGSEKMEEQLKRLKPDIHVYGHSHIARNLIVDGVRYINNAFGYPQERRICAGHIYCVYDSVQPYDEERIMQSN